MSSTSTSTESTWIPRESLAEILKNNGINNEIRDIDIVLPNMQGDHFASTCASITVSFQENIPPIELFIKRPVRNSDFADLMKEAQMYEKEAEFFTVLLPDLKAFCEEKKDYDGFLDGIFPKCYFANDQMILLENLVKNDYVILDKTVSHTVEQAKAVLDRFAKFHAATYVYLKELTVDKFKSKYSLADFNFWGPEGEKLSSVWTKMILDGAIKILEATPTDGSEKALEFLKQHETGLFKTCCEQYDAKSPSCGIVLNHGDVWSCNLMFKFDPATTVPQDCVVIDLQTVHLGSPALDLQLYFFMSIETGICYPNLKEFFQLYYEQFKSNVEKLGAKLDFSLQDLVNDFRKKSLTGFLFSFFLIFGFEMNKEVEDVDDIEGDVVNHLASTMDAVVKKNMASKGKQYSQEIVKSFNEYYKLLAEVD